MTELEEGEPLALEHVIMHALTSGYGYDVAQRAFLDVATEFPAVSEPNPV